MFKSEYHFKFEDLLVYQKAMFFGERVNEFVETFPKKECIGYPHNLAARQTRWRPIFLRDMEVQMLILIDIFKWLGIPVMNV